MRLALALALALAAVALTGVGVVAGALAQQADPSATIVIVHVVRNGRPSSGRVTIRDDDGHEASCEASETGECELSGIGGGRHVVQATDSDGTSGRARAVMIPDGGKVSLIVQLPANS